MKRRVRINLYGYFLFLVDMSGHFIFDFRTKRLKIQKVNETPFFGGVETNSKDAFTDHSPS